MQMMGADQNIAWAQSIASALEWWRDAGVDMLVEDAPRDWLRQPVRAGVAVAAVDAPALEAVLPDTLAAFAAWRTGPEAPEAAWGTPLIGASGDPAAPLMILIDCPEREDDAGMLLSGASGRLFDRMLAAIGFDRASVYLAPVAAARPVSGRIPPETEERLFDIARHLVTLASPQRLLLMGNAASRAILAADAARARGRMHPVHPKEGTETSTQAVATFHPRFLLERPAAKAEAWKDLQLLTGGWQK
jgi:DNA polymerase